ncbi:hypothetical protein QQS45_01625 [Alteriqipengyuania flavescens]|uniref:hypothetical protein n=1 Tax=Alteriqipengyuania flavescens TaxID=3053610 RepID=UPI0025B517A9|nr:hypothetical protein [Alteriqipengyuania flavescens]WJY18975.1 hypothetical protein QQW98_01625 [Alteriqipengyuania flavescens]WJY24915.1 hypothetical protein QQS45_01625 [Alteriqipengyuania flavescens]
MAGFLLLFSAKAQATDANMTQLDARLSGVAHRITAANAPLCRYSMPGLGLSLISRDQYSDTPYDQPHPAFIDDSRVALSAVAADGPAARAGLRAGDALWLAAGEPLPERREEDQFRYMSVFSALADRDSAAPVTLSVSRGAYLTEVTVEPAPACRSLIEIFPSNEKFARADAEIVQISSALAATLDDGQLAVVVAHELAHQVLEHRRRLEEAGVRKGLLAEFGKNARRNRRAEIEADRLSVHLLANAGYDPMLAPQFWLSETGAERDGGWLRSRAYPARERRAALMETEIVEWSLEAGKFSSAAPLVAWRDRSIDIEE